MTLARATAVLACASPLFYGLGVMQKYGISVDQMSEHGRAAAQAAERLQSTTVVYRDKVPVAAIIPMEDLERLDPPDPGAGGDDPLLSMCGTCNNDAFVDQMSDMSHTVLFRRG
ncbi:MAG: hypothetical protein JRI68_18850 [Deltaproteobacteria bacterium]|nr:hypothetical protein [Deltaproteobacteria bacterium]